jgi:ribonucleotide monophosphatase NagD (HAD superfamily)
LLAETTPAILFDIDGVFKHGGIWETKGAAVLHKIAKAGLPYAFMTNGGGGRTEEQYAAELSSKLNAASAVEGAGGGVSVAASNMVLSYSPWRQDLAALRDQPVLVVGDPAGPVVAAAKAFGWTKAMHISEYAAKHPLMNPFKHDNTAVQDGNAWDEGFAAVCVFTDPLNFFEALQICSDVLLSSRPGITEVERGHAIPIFFSNPDLLWKTQHPFGRFGQV